MIVLIGLLFIVSCLHLYAAHKDGAMATSAWGKVLITAMLLLMAIPAFSQGAYFSSNAWTVSRNVAPGQSAPIYTLPYAQVTVCNTIGSVPLTCGQAVDVYSDAALTQVIPQPLTADAQGNFAFYVPPGQYLATATGTNGTQQLIPLTIGGQGPPFDNQGIWISTKSYLAGQIVTYGTAVYMSTVSGNLNHQPDISPVQWTQISLPGSVVTSPTAGQVITQPAPTSLDVNVLNHVVYADRYCTTPGTYDQSCLANAVAAAGNNSMVVLGGHNYAYASKTTFHNLTNITVRGESGASITSNGTAIECDDCTNYSFKGVRFASSVTPAVIPCDLIAASRSMTCTGLPTVDPNANIVLDPWRTGTGHIPTGTDQILLPVGALSAAQKAQNWDSGLSFLRPTNVVVENNTGTYYHIVMLDSVGSIVRNNQIMGGNGAADTSVSAVPSDRCGAICFMFIARRPPGWFANHDNIVIGNTITYPASLGIEAINATGTVITGNNVSYGGESGITLGQGISNPFTTVTATLTAGSTTATFSTATGVIAGMLLTGAFISEGTAVASSPVGTTVTLTKPAQGTVTETISVWNSDAISYYSAGTTITGNVAHHMLFDGFDISSDAGHSSRAQSHNTTTGNFSYANFGTGFYGDGIGDTITANTAWNNEAFGFGLDNYNSTIVGNTAIDNNLQRNAAQSQFAIGAAIGTNNGGNTVSSNQAVVTDTTINGYGFYANNNSGPVNMWSNNSDSGISLSDNLMGIKFSASPISITGLEVAGVSTAPRVAITLNQVAGSNSPIVQTGDAVQLVDTNGIVNTGAMSVVGHNAGSVGYRIDNAGKTLTLYGDNGVILPTSTKATSLVGTGTALVCAHADGTLYRATTTTCP